MRSHFTEIVLWGSWPLNRVGQEDHSQNYILNLSWGWGLQFLLLIYLTIKGEYFLSQLASSLGLIYCCSFCPRKLDPVTCPKVLRETQTWTPVWEKHPVSISKVGGDGGCRDVGKGSNHRTWPSSSLPDLIELRLGDLGLRRFEL